MITLTVTVLANCNLQIYHVHKASGHIQIGGFIEMHMLLELKSYF